MAAGFSMQEDRLEEFREKLNANATLTEDDFAEKVHIDVALPISYLSESLINEFELLEPFGNENTKPLFACPVLSRYSFAAFTPLAVISFRSAFSCVSASAFCLQSSLSSHRRSSNASFAEVKRPEALIHGPRINPK